MNKVSHHIRPGMAALLKLSQMGSFRNLSQESLIMKGRGKSRPRRVQILPEPALASMTSRSRGMPTRTTTCLQLTNTGSVRHLLLPPVNGTANGDEISTTEKTQSGVPESVNAGSNSQTRPDRHSQYVSCDRTTSHIKAQRSRRHMLAAATVLGPRLGSTLSDPAKAAAGRRVGR